MKDSEMLEKLKVAFELLSREKNAIVVPLEDILHKAGFAKKSKQVCVELLKKSGEFKLDFKKEDVMVCMKNFKPMEIPMNQKNAETKNTLSLHDRIKTLRDTLSNGLYEKDEVVRLALLTAIAGESIFLLGEPGCAKSMIARRIVQAFKADGDNAIKYFETLLNEYTTPDEVFGNVSLKALNGELDECKGKEEYRRLTENMLPEADIAFLDEIWKAGSAILNTLLTIVNERKFHNGSKVVEVPLKTLFAASNELPAKNQGLEALYDRLVLRLMVSFIKDEDNFFEMVEAPSSSKFELSDDVKKLQITNAELQEWKEKIDEVTLSEGAKSVISAIRKELSSRNAAMDETDKLAGETFEVGDRRWKKIVHILKTSAFLNDRTEVDLMDCQLIEYCIWSTEKQQKQARDIVEKCIRQNGLDCDTAIDEINEQIESFDKVITERFFIKKKADYAKYTMSDGKQAYKFVNPKEIYFADQRVVPCYISNDFNWSGLDDRRGMLYDSSRNKLGPNSNFSFLNFNIAGVIVTWTDWWRNISGIRDKSYSMEIETVPGGIQKDPCLFDAGKERNLHAIQKEVDESNYKPIADVISAEIQKLEEFALEKAAPYEANLFANQNYCETIMSAVNDAKKTLQDAQVKLDKERNRYQS